MTGFVVGYDLLKMVEDFSGLKVLGIFNNCVNGEIFWGIYFICEENFDDFFGVD